MITGEVLQVPILKPILFLLCSNNIVKLSKIMYILLLAANTSCFLVGPKLDVLILMHQVRYQLVNMKLDKLSQPYTVKKLQ